MAKSKRKIVREVLVGLRELKRGESGRVLLGVAYGLVPATPVPTAAKLASSWDTPASRRND